MKIKYLGTADIRLIPKGDDFGGLLAEGISVDVEWNADNRWIVDTDAPEFKGVDAEVWEAILDDTESFQDVSKFKRVPLNAHQRTFLGMSDGEQPTEAEEKAAAEERERQREERRREAEEAAKEANAAERQAEAAQKSGAAKKSGGARKAGAAKKSAGAVGSSGGGGGGTTVDGSTTGGGGTVTGIGGVGNTTSAGGST